MDKILPPDSFTNTSHPGMGVAGHTHASPRGDTAASRALQATLSPAERADLAACRWYEHAASAGEPQAQHWLANRLWGEGHIQEAMGLWTDAAAQGWAPAHMALGKVAYAQMCLLPASISIPDVRSQAARVLRRQVRRVCEGKYAVCILVMCAMPQATS